MIRTEFPILLVLSACAVILMDFLCIASESHVGISYSENYFYSF